jgi:hypothetical protein
VTDAESRRWTNIYVQFSLPEHDQHVLDERLLAEGTTIGLLFRKALHDRLRAYGIDPAHLDRPEADVDHGHHHGS